MQEKNSDCLRPIRSVTIVIPAFNEAESIPLLVEELRAATNPLETEFDIIFVDDGSTDSTSEVIINLAENDSTSSEFR